MQFFIIMKRCPRNVLQERDYQWYKQDYLNVLENQVPAKKRLFLETVQHDFIEITDCCILQYCFVYNCASVGTEIAGFRRDPYLLRVNLIVAGAQVSLPTKQPDVLKLPSQSTVV